MGKENSRNEKAGINTFNRRSILLGGTALAAASVLGTSITQAQTPPTQKPNILFMLVDNLGYGELGVYGGGATRGAPTPRIDKLASEGLRLTNMNMEAQCTPSRSSHPDRALCDPLGHPLGAVRRRRRRPHAMGSDDGRVAVGRGLRDSALRKMASRQSGWPPAQRPGIRRMVRHPPHHRRSAVARLGRLFARHHAAGTNHGGTQRREEPRR